MGEAPGEQRSRSTLDSGAVITEISRDGRTLEVHIEIKRGASHTALAEALLWAPVDSTLEDIAGRPYVSTPDAFELVFEVAQAGRPPSADAVPAPGRQPAIGERSQGKDAP